MTAGGKLALGGLIVCGATAYMAYVGASSGWTYYLTTDECVAQAAELAGQRLRVSGRVGAGTLRIADNRNHATFVLEGGRDRRLRVICAAVLPDNLAEDMDVVVEGRLEARGVLRGDKVLTRCASKYQPGETNDGVARDPAAGVKEAG